MTETFLIIGGVAVTVGEALTGFACVVLALLGAIAVMLARGSRARVEEAARHDIHAGELEERMAENARIQSDTAGRAANTCGGLSRRPGQLPPAGSQPPPSGAAPPRPT